MTANLPVTTAKLPPLTGCDVKLMLPHECDAHRKAICLEVEIVLKGYWQDKRSFEMDAAVKAWWMDELEDWTAEQVRWAMRKWCRDNPDRRPNPGHILGLLRESWGKRHAHQVRAALAPPVEQPKERISDERRRAILIEAGLRDPLAAKTIDGITPTENR